MEEAPPGLSSMIECITQGVSRVRGRTLQYVWESRYRREGVEGKERGEVGGGRRGRERGSFRGRARARVREGEREKTKEREKRERVHAHETERGESSKVRDSDSKV